MARTIPETMTAIEIAEPGGPEVLKPTSRPTPIPGDDDVLIEVVAAGVNRPDVMQRQGGYAPPPGASDIPGLEVAGRVVAAGSRVKTCSEGDEVVALVTGGGYAQYCVSPAAQCLPTPAGVDLIHAAAIPETYFTVYSNVFERGGLKAGERFLVHGGSSGIGTTAIQLARHFGADVLTTAGTADKCRASLDLGANLAINYREDDFVKAVREHTEEQGVDLVLDMVGGSYIRRNIEALAPDGRLVMIAFLGGSIAEVDFLPVMLKRLTVTGSTLRARDVRFKADIAAKLREHVWPLLESGDIRVLVHRTFALEDAASAHALMESSEHIGKIVLTR